MEHYGDVLQSNGVALDEVESEWTALKTAVYSEQQVYISVFSLNASIV